MRNVHIIRTCKYIRSLFARIGIKYELNQYNTKNEYEMNGEERRNEYEKF